MSLFIYNLYLFIVLSHVSKENIRFLFSRTLLFFYFYTKADMNPHCQRLTILLQFLSITKLIFSVKEGHFPHDGYFGLLKPILRPTPGRLHELLNLVERKWEDTQQECMSTRSKCHAVKALCWPTVGNQWASRDEWRRKKQLNRLIKNPTICDSPWVTVQPLIRKAIPHIQ